MEDKKTKHTWNSVLGMNLDWLLVWKKKTIKNILGKSKYSSYTFI